MTYGEFLKTIRNYCINRRLNNVILVNEPIEALIEFAKIKKKKGHDAGETLFYETTEASKIVNNKLEIPLEFRDALGRIGGEEAVEEGFSEFYDNYIDKNRSKALVEDLISSIERDSSFKHNEVSDIMKCADDPGIFLARILIKSLKENNYIENVDETVIWKKGKSYVRIIKGDIFAYVFGKRKKNNRIVVIPVNTGFDTHVSTKLEQENKPVVSSTTLHGQLLLRIYKSGITEEEVKTRIHQNLMINNLITGKEKNISCPVGSIAVFDFDPITLYLLAVSVFDKENKAQSSKKVIRTALEKMLDYYDRKGMGYDIYLPLIGTGLSRAYFDNQESLDLILDVFKNNVSHLQGRINIVIKPEVFNEIDIRKEL